MPWSNEERDFHEKLLEELRTFNKNFSSSMNTLNENLVNINKSIQSINPVITEVSGKLFLGTPVSQK
jgi:hypothetical protein